MYRRSSISNKVFDIFREIGLKMNSVGAVIFIVIWIKVCKTKKCKLGEECKKMLNVELWMLYVKLKVKG